MRCCAVYCITLSSLPYPYISEILDSTATSQCLTEGFPTQGLRTDNSGYEERSESEVGNGFP